MLSRSVAVWFGLLVLAIANGAIREALLTPRFGAGTGHAISTATLCGAILLLAWLTLRWIAPRTLSDAWNVGLMWVALTVAFEFLAGHYLFGQPWERLLADYNILRGRIWILVLVTTLVAPRIAAAWRGLHAGTYADRRPAEP